jgi:hypothetical protein
MTPSGIKSATFRLVAQCLNQLRQMGFPRLKPETFDTIQTPDCSMKTHHTLPIPNPISTVLLQSPFQTMTTQILTDIT